MLKLNIGNGTEGTFEFRPSVNRAITDTGTPFIIVPKVDYYAFKEVICKYIRQSGKNMDCIDTEKSVEFTNCLGVGKDSNLPNVQLYIDQYMYTLPPSFYARYSKDISDNCDFLFDYSYTSNNRWIIGPPFLNLFYQVYDMKRN